MTASDPASRRARLSALLALAAVTSAVTVTPSAAAPTRHRFATFHLDGSHGYRIVVKASTARAALPFPFRTGENRPGAGEVTVSVLRHGARAAYSAPATLRDGRLRARLGRFGRIDLGFHPKPAAVPASKTQICEAYEEGTIGTFTGTFRFRGEHGYTSASTRRVGGALGFRTAHCKPGPSLNLHATELIARSPNTLFAALRGPGGAAFAVRTRERDGRIRIERSVDRVTGASRFTVDPGLSSAHVGPGPSPFSGSADFTPPHRWEGSLSVSLPGAPHVPLAGPEFAATLKDL